MMAVNDDTIGKIESQYPERDRTTLEQDLDAEELLESFMDQLGVTITDRIDTEQPEEALKGRSSGNFGEFYFNTHFSYLDNDFNVNYRNMPASFPKEDAADVIGKLVDEKEVVDIAMADAEGSFKMEEGFTNHINDANCIIFYGEPIISPTIPEDPGSNEAYFRQVKEVFNEESIGIAVVMNGQSNQGYVTAAPVQYPTRTFDGMIPHDDKRYSDLDWGDPRGSLG